MCGGEGAGGMCLLLDSLSGTFSFLLVHKVAVHLTADGNLDSMK